MTLQTINSILGTSYAENDFNISVVSSIADITDAQLIEYKNTQMATDTGKHILKCLKRWYKANGGNVTKAPATNPEPTPETIPTPVTVSTTPAPAPTSPAAPSTNDPAAMLTQAIQAISAASISEARVMELINKALESQEPKKTVLEVKTSRGVHEIPAGLTHYRLETVLKMIEDGDKPYLFGPAGTGKTELARQVAQALGLDFYFTGKISDETALVGYTDIRGEYIETAFYKAFTNGGVFLFDEMDACAPDALTKFNAALANNVCDFPNGCFKAHKDFIIIAAGNTCGRGGDGLYTSREPLDAATMDRFVPLKVDYDPAIEDANGDADAVKFVRVLRRAAEKNGIELIASVRMIKKLSDLRNILAADDLMNIVRCTLSADDLNIIRNDANMSRLIVDNNYFAMAL